MGLSRLHRQALGRRAPDSQPETVPSSTPSLAANSACREPELPTQRSQSSTDGARIVRGVIAQEVKDSGVLPRQWMDSPLLP